ncbi:MAG: hypothetical protein P4L27_14355 [Ignavibacteriaceae bacterium]|nr:hypothetical protein [Ignavibacteriaceae bacterium]
MKLGFIVEGDTEKILLDSYEFKSFLDNQNLLYVEPIINAKGSGNLLPHNISGYINVLKQQGADKILILTDLDDSPCYSEVKKRIDGEGLIICIAKRKIEAWFLSDSTTLSSLLRKKISCEFPEDIPDPFEYLSNLRQLHQGKGFSDKKILAQKMLRNGFSIENAKDHPNCPSAKYFYNKLF